MPTLDVSGKPMTYINRKYMIKVVNRYLSLNFSIYRTIFIINEFYENNNEVSILIIMLNNP
jgi:hypothetical protein